MPFTPVTWTDCVLGEHLDVDGYARVSGGRKGFYQKAHRVVWEKAHGAIPGGMQIHHRCGNRACVNVEHLEVVSPSEHKERHQKCDHDDWYVSPRGTRECRVCKAARRVKERELARERRLADPERLEAWRRYHREYQRARRAEVVC